jgi:hypothetical protein
VERGVAFDGEPHLIARMADHDLWMDLLALMAEAPRS